jgi:hypothetical protein
MLLNEKKAKIRELTNNGPIPEARIPDSPPTKIEESQEHEPKQKRGRAATSQKVVKPPLKSTTKKPLRSTRGKRKRTPTPEPPPEETEMALEEGDNENEGEDDQTEDEEDASVQGEDIRDEDFERAFGVSRGDEDDRDVTDDEEL